MGFEIAASVADKREMERNELKNYLDGLSNATRADKEKMDQMASTNEAMVELCHQLTEAKIQNGKQITDLILQIAKLTKLLKEKSTKQAGSERNKRTAVIRYEKYEKYNNVHKKRMCWEDEANKAIHPANWNSTLE